MDVFSNLSEKANKSDPAGDSSASNCMPEELRPFDARRAYDDTRALCYPRRVGTLSERRAARFILRRFANLGLRQQREPFYASLFPTEFSHRLVLVLCALLVLLGAYSATRWRLVAVACWCSAAFFINAPWRLARSFGARCPPRRFSENVLGTLPVPTRPAPARVVFMAHYDTKSQWLPIGIRVAMVTVATGLCIVLAMLGLLERLGLSGSLTSMGPYPLGTTIVLLLVGLIVNCNGNRSPGALDNASAVATLLELARTWRPRPEHPAEVIWVASGAEEIGASGARSFCQLHEAWWREKPTLLINLESVGAGSRIYLCGERQALYLAEETAEKLRLPHARLHVLGASMDHEPFVECRLPAISVLGDVVRNSLTMHSPRDNMNVIELAALERAGQLAAHIAWRWAEVHQSAIAVPARDLRQRVLNGATAFRFGG